MGKIRTRTIGLEDVEEQEKQEARERAKAKKEEKKHKKAGSKAMEELKSVEAKEKAEEQEGEKEVVEKSEPVKEKKEEKKAVSTHARGKKYKEAMKQVDRTKVYTLPESVTLLKKIKYASFDESVELHLNVKEQGIKGEVALPHTTGKTVRVKVVDDALLDNLEKGVIDFDVLVTHPSFMPKLAKYARTLGPKGLMPNPKAGTVSTNPDEVVKKFEKGTLRYKTEPKFPLMHQIIGKISHDEKDLVENADAFLNAVGRTNITAAFIKTTMSPSLKIQVS